MATLTTAFRTETERVHREHQILDQVLHKLDAALERLVCYSEVFADLASAEQVRCYGLQLAEHFPGHCQREEAAVLDPVSQISSELGQFCREMKNEHAELLAQLGTFRAALEAFDSAEDLSETICHLKQKGKELTSNLRRHVSREEHELSGFL